MNKHLLLFLVFLTLSFNYAQAQCSGVHPIISQVAEGSSNNKAVELLNPKNSPIDLSLYELVRYANGGFPSGSTISLSGMLQPGETFVLANGSADPAILAVADLTTGTISHNGNDSYVLQLVSDGTVIDSYGDADNSSTFGANVNQQRILTVDTPCPYDTDPIDGFDATAYTEEPYTTGLPTGLGENIVPIELKSFNVSLQNDNIIINWTTLTEVDNSHFNILYSNDGRSFETIESIEGNGFSMEEIDYSFVIRNAEAGMHYFQLEQVDYNGESEKFNIEFVEIKRSVVSINPTSTAAILNVQGLNTASNYTIFSVVGQSIQSGVTTGTVEINQLLNGTYFIRIEGETFKFFKI